MNIKTQLIIALIVLGVVDVVTPVPITSLILISVVVQRPSWFKNIVRKIYKAK